MRIVLVVLQVLVITALAALLVQGDGPGSHETVLTITRDHGVNAGDLPVAGLWLLGVGASLLSLRRRD